MAFLDTSILRLKVSHATFWDQADLEPKEAGIVSHAHRSLSPLRLCPGSSKS